MRNAFGYILGFLVFVAGIPALMWWVSGRNLTWVPPLPLAIISIVLMFLGLALSIWSIVYMKNVGKGNPMDAFNHEGAPRTSQLMTDGPYKICRNPMLLGVFLYYLGVVIFLHSWQAIVIFAAYIAIMMVQVSREEKRLESDFGEAYKEYKKKTKKLIPFIW